jgi:hypothetical protein
MSLKHYWLKFECQDNWTTLETPLLNKFKFSSPSNSRSWKLSVRGETPQNTNRIGQLHCWGWSALLVNEKPNCQSLCVFLRLLEARLSAVVASQRPQWRAQYHCALYARRISSRLKLKKLNWIAAICPCRDLGNMDDVLHHQIWMRSVEMLLDLLLHIFITHPHWSVEKIWCTNCIICTTLLVGAMQLGFSPYGNN